MAKPETARAILGFHSYVHYLTAFTFIESSASDTQNILILETLELNKRVQLLLLSTYFTYRH